MTVRRKKAEAGNPRPAKRVRKSAAAASERPQSSSSSSLSAVAAKTKNIPTSPPKKNPVGSSSANAVVDPRETSLSSSSSLFEYLERIPPSALRSIYALPPPRGPAAVVAVLRSPSSLGSDLARQFALRLSACGGRFGVRGIVEGWTKRHRRKEAFVALRRMEAMGVVSGLGLSGTRLGEEEELDVGAGAGAENAYEGDDAHDEDGGGTKSKLMEKDACLTEEFKKGIALHLSTMASSPWPAITPEQINEYKRSVGGGNTGGDAEKPSREPPTRHELEVYTQSSWDSVLHFLVGSDVNDGDRKGGDAEGGIEEPPDTMVSFLERVGLMQKDPDYAGFDRSRAPLVITSKGYEFMLRDTNAQVWQFVLQYLNSMTHFRLEALSFLLCLGGCRVGEGYHSSVLGSKSSRTVMKDFARFGLLYVCRVAGKLAFYPTRVAVNLASSSSTAAAGDKGRRDATGAGGQSASSTRALEGALSAAVPSRSHLAVVVQTNFQVCAYTNSKLQIATLGLFCDVSSYRRLPNVVFFHLTRDSIRSAFRLGVTAEQILRFLHVHAHPMLRSGGQPLVPPNVGDQIMLWDRERTRVVMDEVWVHQCRDAAEYAAVCQYASDSDALAWGAAHTNKLYIHFHHANQVFAFVRRWKTNELKKQI